jgi:hypothetical protein
MSPTDLLTTSTTPLILRRERIHQLPLSSLIAPLLLPAQVLVRLRTSKRQAALPTLPTPLRILSRVTHLMFQRKRMEITMGPPRRRTLLPWRQRQSTLIVVQKAIPIRPLGNPKTKPLSIVESLHPKSNLPFLQRIRRTPPRAIKIRHLLPLRNWTLPTSSTLD